MRKKIIFIIAGAVVLVALLAGGAFFLLRSLKKGQEVTIPGELNIEREHILGREAFLEQIQDDPGAKKVFKLAQEQGYTFVGRTVEGKEGETQVMVAPLYNQEGEVILLDRMKSQGGSKTNLIKIDFQENTLTTYNDADSGITTDLEKGEVKETWGPLAHHSDEYDFDLDWAKANWWIWHIGLQDDLTFAEFQVFCGYMAPDSIFDVLMNATDDIYEALVNQVLCASFLAQGQDHIARDIEDGSIANFTPDLRFGSIFNVEPVAYEPGEPGKFTAYVKNRGMGYSGSFEVDLMGKKEGQAWRTIETKTLENLRPEDSNNDFPGETEIEFSFEYSPEEKETIALVIDPRDIIDEQEENNNQFTFTRADLNQKPTASIDYISPNPTEAGQLTILRGKAVDPDGHIGLRGYEWDFGDGTTWRTGSTVYYYFHQAGKRTIKLRAYDAEGLASDWVSHEVTVTEPLNRPEADKEKIMIHTAFYAPDDNSTGLTWIDGELVVSAKDYLYFIDPETGYENDSTLHGEITEHKPKYLDYDGTHIWLADQHNKDIYKMDLGWNIVDNFVAKKEFTGMTNKLGKIEISTDGRAVARLGENGDVTNIFETPEQMNGLEWYGGNYWGASPSKIAWLDDDLNLYRYFNVSGNACPEGEFFLGPPYHPSDFAWDGQYMWILSPQGSQECWQDNKFRKPVIYKVDAQGYYPPYIEVLPGHGDLMQGVLWDGDGFIVEQSWQKAYNQLVKFSHTGEFMGHISGENIRKEIEGGVLDLAMDEENFWVLKKKKVAKIDNQGNILETWDPPSEDVVSFAFYDDELWFATKDKFYVTDYSGRIDFEYESPVKGIADFVWAGGFLWLTNSSGRIFKIEFEDDALKMRQIFAPFGEKNTGTRHLGWDGQYLWYAAYGELYKLEHIPISPDATRFRQPILTPETQQIPYEEIAEGARADVCYLVPAEQGGEEYWQEREHQVIRNVYPRSQNEIYITRNADGFEFYDGQRLFAYPRLVLVRGQEGYYNGSEDLIDYPGNGRLMAAMHEGIYEFDGAGWYERYGTLDPGFDAEDFSLTPDGTLFAGGQVWRALENDVEVYATIARYEEGQWNLFHEFEDVHTTNNEIFMFSEDSGFMANKEGLYRYQDGSWTKQNCDYDVYLEDIAFASENSGYLTGGSSFLMHYDGNTCQRLRGLPHDFWGKKIILLGEDRFLLIGTSYNLANSFFYYDGENFRRIALTDIVFRHEDRLFNELYDLREIPGGGLAIVGAEAILLICSDRERVIASTDFRIEVQNGDLVRIEANGEENTIVDKNDFEGIEEFADVKLSPDKSHMCFIGKSMVPKWMFVGRTNGENVEKLGLGENCAWARDSRKFAYNNHVTDVSPVDVYLYRINENWEYNEATNLTIRFYNTPRGTSMYTFKEPSWSEDDQYIFSEYGGFDGQGNMLEGKMMYNLENNTATELAE